METYDYLHLKEENINNIYNKLDVPNISNILNNPQKSFQEIKLKLSSNLNLQILLVLDSLVSKLTSADFEVKILFNRILDEIVMGLKNKDVSLRAF
jgi:hypothetical protein